MELVVKRVALEKDAAIERVDEVMERGGRGENCGVGEGGGVGGGLELHRVGCVNWPEEWPDRPDVSFRIAHSGNEIYLKFYVREQALRAVYDHDGERPWEESCVEFFICPAGDAAGDEGGENPAYCNLEMSCIGFGILNSGPRGNRHPGPVELVRRLASMPRVPFGVKESGEGGEGGGSESGEGESGGGFEWTITLAIPVEALGRGTIEPGTALRANLYKCGDMLPRPHFLSWSPIETPKPSFHEPEQFGALFFE